MFAKLSQLSKPVKQGLFFVLKLMLSALALVVVFRKIDFSQTQVILKSLDWPWLILALLFFNLSKVLSAFRLSGLFRAIGLNMPEIQNLRLYYIGMFYNLFLPGGIGGDAYKIVMLKKRKQSKIKETTLAVFLDRLSGVAAIVVIMGIIALSALNASFSPFIIQSIIVLIVLIYPLFFNALFFFLPKFKKAFFKMNAFALGVQLSQVASALLLLKAMSVNSQFSEYILLFLFSSIVTIVPVTIGGLGARELSFLWGQNVLHVEINSAITLGLLFFLITVLSSFVGAFLRFEGNGDLYQSSK